MLVGKCQTCSQILLGKYFRFFKVSAFHISFMYELWTMHWYAISYSSYSMKLVDVPNFLGDILEFTSGNPMIQRFPQAQGLHLGKVISITDPPEPVGFTTENHHSFCHDLSRGAPKNLRKHRKKHTHPYIWFSMTYLVDNSWKPHGKKQMDFQKYIQKTRKTIHQLSSTQHVPSKFDIFPTKFPKKPQFYVQPRHW